MLKYKRKRGTRPTRMPRFEFPETTQAFFGLAGVPFSL